jgi:UDP-N-acetylmuramate--alanine ligase
MMDVAGLDPTVVNGGIVNAYGTNTRFGESEWMVVEADESDGSFTRLPATVAVVTNIDPEHMDHYGSFDEVKKAYKRFILNLPFHGYALLCIDHPEVQGLIPQVSDRKIITYGFNPQADIHAFNIRSDAQGSMFDVRFALWLSESGEEEILRDVHLSMLGQHNIQNSLAALGVAKEMRVAPPIMKKALTSFSGVKRRFTLTGEANGITVIDDYAHHPIEIEVVLKTARTAVDADDGNVIAVVQPHRYSRLQDLFDDFCRCFNEADAVIVADVYAAGEAPIEGATKESLAVGIKKHGHRAVQVLEDKDQLARLVASVARPGDYVICMGAGDITKWAYALPEKLAAELEKQKGSAA